MTKIVSEEEMKSHVEEFAKTAVSQTGACLAEHGMNGVDLTPRMASDHAGDTVYAAPSGLDVTLVPQGDGRGSPKIVARPRSSRPSAINPQVQTNTDMRRILEKCVSEGATNVPPRFKP